MLLHASNIFSGIQSVGELYARWCEAIFLLHTSDIITGALGRGNVEYSALSYSVIACSKENQWEEGLNLLNIYGTASKYGTQIASVDCVNSVIAAAGRKGRPDIAIKILNEMTSKYSVAPNERTYRSAIVRGIRDAASEQGHSVLTQ